MYPTLLGIKLINVATNQLVRLLGKMENTERFLNITLFQGTPLNVGESQAAAMGSGLILADQSALAGRAEDPTIFALAYNKQRFFW